MTFAILCTGPSMSQAVADSVRELRVIAVNGAYQFAPEAEALVANDLKWWLHNPEALKSSGRKFCTTKQAGIEHIPPAGMIGTNTCSGVLALEVAKRLGAKRVLLLGADFGRGHYFGDYQRPLRNATAERRKTHAKQFRRWRDENPAIEVLNCTPGSALDVFPKGPLESVLHPMPREVAA